MKSGLRRLRNQKTPIPLSPAGFGRGAMRFPLAGGTANMDSYLQAYTQNGTIYSIVSLLAEKAAQPKWRLYKKQPLDGRRRYTTGDVGSDQRTEIVRHPLLKLWNKPNDFFTGFEFREGSNQHAELTGETFWVINRENALRMPTSMWYVTPSRMTPVPDPEQYLLGWLYTSPNGQQIPLQLDEVILEKRPDPTDGYRGTGPIAAIMANIQAQRYATEYQRNLFINGANAGGVLTVPGELSDTQFADIVNRWREQHQGVARAGTVGVLEGGIQYSPIGTTPKDLEYGQLRLANRDEMREAYRIHKSMLGTSDDVNRANAVTAQEVFDNTLLVSRLDRRRETLNSKLLPMYGDDSIEFDYDSPEVPNKEQQIAELTGKAAAWAALVHEGAHPDAAADVVGLPPMEMAQAAAPDPTVVEPAIDDPNGALAALLLRPFTARALPAAAQNRRR